MPKRPNILFVFPDQLSARWMSNYGSTVVQTPQLATFAALRAWRTRTPANTK